MTKIGAKCKGQYGSPGRYVGEERVLCVSAMTNELMLQALWEVYEEPPDLPYPSDEEVRLVANAGVVITREAKDERRRILGQDEA